VTQRLRSTNNPAEIQAYIVELQRISQAQSITGDTIREETRIQGDVLDGETWSEQIYNYLWDSAELDRIQAIDI